ncbi:MAG: DNA polymerase III subunit delta', partial [Acinetobacter junii]
MTKEVQIYEHYPWHQQTWDLLTSHFPDVGHGLLFYGKKGCAKQE